MGHFRVATAPRPSLRCVDNSAERSTFNPSGAASLVELWCHLERVALGLIVVDPQLRVLLCEHVGDALHRGKGLVLVGVDRRHAPVLPEGAWRFAGDGANVKAMTAG